MTYSLSFSRNLMEAFLTSIPLIIEGTLHMIVVKKDYLSYFVGPMSQNEFEKNKIQHGVILMPKFIAPVSFLTNSIGLFKKYIYPLVSK